MAGGFWACDNHFANVNASLDPELLLITLGRVEADGSVYVKIPAAIYGDSETDLNGATLDIYLNGGLVLSGLKVASFFNWKSDQIIFTFNPVVAGDRLGFATNHADGSALFYAGTVSDEAESTASLSVPDFSVSVDETGEMELFFDEMYASQGDGQGDAFSGEYTVTFDTLTFSSDCEADFIQEMAFYVNSGDATEDIDAYLANEKPGFKTTVIVTQSDDTFFWDDTGSTVSDFVGVVNADGSFTIFEGSYVDENNFIYRHYKGTFDSNAGSLSGTLTAELVLDGTRLTNELVGSCSVSQSFNGKLAE